MVKLGWILAFLEIGWKGLPFNINGTGRVYSLSLPLEHLQFFSPTRGGVGPELRHGRGIVLSRSPVQTHTLQR